MSKDADVEVGLVAQEGDISSLGWRLTGVRLPLNQVANARSRGPRGFVEDPIDRDTRRDPSDGGRARVLGFDRLTSRVASRHCNHDDSYPRSVSHDAYVTQTSTCRHAPGACRILAGDHQRSEASVLREARAENAGSIRRTGSAGDGALPEGRTSGETREGFTPGSFAAPRHLPRWRCRKFQTRFHESSCSLVSSGCRVRPSTCLSNRWPPGGLW